MTTNEEKLVLEGGRLKLLCERRAVEAKNQSGVVVDYLRFTIKRDHIPQEKSFPYDRKNVQGEPVDQHVARWFAEVFAQLLGFKVGQDRPGRDYYDFTTTIENDNGHEVASVSAGGQSQRNTVCFTLKGEGCTMARPGWQQRVHRYFEDMLPTVTRVDLAKDFFCGEVSVDEVVHLYKSHEFSYRNRMPKFATHGAWALGTDSEGMPIGGHSRTFQVGKRESGKLFRAYEKGHQFGRMEDPWLRAELELRNVNRVIPWEVLLHCADYFAGGYPATQLLCNRETATRIPTATVVAQASAERCVRWVERVVAPTLAAITKSMPDEDWLVGLVVEHANRRVPRSLRGLNVHAIQHGLQHALRKFTNPCEPAAVAA